jgi:hypothetical protein
MPGIGQKSKTCIAEECAAQLSRQSNHIPSLQFGARDVCQVDGNATSRLCRLDRVSVCLQTPDTCPHALWEYLDLLPYFEDTIEQGAGDDCAEAGHSEDAINREAWTANILALVRLIEESI